MKTLIYNLWHNPSTARKFYLALVGAIVTAGSQGLLPAAIAGWVAVIGPVLTAVGVYAVPNAETPFEYPKMETFE